MKARNLIQLTFFIILTAIACKGNSEFDPGPFARGDKGDKTLQSFTVSDASGNPIKGAYVVSYRKLAPVHKRVGEGYTDEQGKIQIEDETNTTTGYATIVAPGYNSKQIALNIAQKQDNNIAVTLADQDVLKVMGYNILLGFNNNEQLRQEFADWVKLYDPDIILFQEASNFTDASFSAFAKTFGHDYAVLTKTIGIPTGITSKEPITDIRKIVRTGILHHGYVTGETFGLRVFSIHLCPYELDNERNIYQIARKDEIKIIMDDADDYTDVPVVIGGDFNDHNTFDSESYGAGYPYANRDHTVYNTVKEYSFNDTYPLLHTDFKPSWRVEFIVTNSSNPGARLDYLFVNNNLKNSIVFSDILHSAYTDKFSDHYPTYIEIKK